MLETLRHLRSAGCARRRPRLQTPLLFAGSPRHLEDRLHVLDGLVFRFRKIKKEVDPAAEAEDGVDEEGECLEPVNIELFSKSYIHNLIFKNI